MPDQSAVDYAISELRELREYVAGKRAAAIPNTMMYEALDSIDDEIKARMERLGWICTDG